MIDEKTLNDLIKKSTLLENLLIETVTDSVMSDFLAKYTVDIMLCPLVEQTVLEVYINKLEFALRDYKVDYENKLREFYKNEQ